jgi:hypothetical protein
MYIQYCAGTERDSLSDLEWLVDVEPEMPVSAGE